MNRDRVLSGMRPTGALHLGHYHGALKNWVRLQSEHECFFFVADWHALTTHYDTPEVIAANVWEMVIDWLAAGIDPSASTLFIQSKVPEHAELHVLLSMCTPLGWLERVPTYKDQQEKLTDRDLTTYGFLGYPLLQSADIMMYQAAWVPVGEDQVPHVELTREVARRFNHLFGRQPGLEDRVAAARRRLGGKRAQAYDDYLQRHQQQGDPEAVALAKQLVDGTQSLSDDERATLIGWLEGGRRRILVEPQALLTEASKVPGLDGAKMSKSYGNAVGMREDPASVTKKLRQMPTDPARVRRTDPGNPENCPVWQLHKVYSNDEVRAWADRGCRSAGIGCLDCKQPVIDAIVAEQTVFIERARPYVEDPRRVRDIMDAGCERARTVARETMRDVRDVMGLGYA